MGSNVVIVAAKRTPQGRFMGGLAKRSAVELGVAAGKAALSSLDGDAGLKIDSVIVGNVLQAGQGMNMARQIGVNLGLSEQTPAFTVNQMCASGILAVMLASQAIRAGDANVVLCGGSESMTNAPYLLKRARTGYKLGDGELIDSLLRDGLVDAFDRKHMGLTAERLATEGNISREAQDAFAARSQQRYGAAHESGVFTDELTPVDDLQADEHPRPETTADQLAALKPVFDQQGSVTPGNASGINDGAAMLVVCSEQAAKENGWTPMAIIEGSSSVGCDPARMGLGPVHATNRLCEALSCGVDAFDHIELNEAFAAQALACGMQLKLDDAKLNPHGGAIALGHPIGASGARLVTHLSHLIAKGEVERGLATLCVGGGMGAAVALKQP